MYAQFRSYLKIIIDPETLRRENVNESLLHPKLHSTEHFKIFISILMKVFRVFSSFEEHITYVKYFCIGNGARLFWNNIFDLYTKVVVRFNLYKILK